MARDDVLIRLHQVCEMFHLGERRVRRWIDAGILLPVNREGQGRSGAMYFSRGEVAELVHGYCETCAGWFKKATLKQRFCSTSCRKKWHYRQSHSRRPGVHRC